MQYVPVDPHFNFHYANGYEVTEEEECSVSAVKAEGDNGNITSTRTTTRIVIDTVRCANMEFGEGQPGKPVWQDLDYAKLVPYSRLVR